MMLQIQSDVGADDVVDEPQPRKKQKKSSDVSHMEEILSVASSSLLRGLSALEKRREDESTSAPLTSDEDYACGMQVFYQLRSLKECPEKRHIRNAILQTAYRLVSNCESVSTAQPISGPPHFPPGSYYPQSQGQNFPPITSTPRLKISHSQTSILRVKIFHSHTATHRLKISQPQLATLHV